MRVLSPPSGGVAQLGERSVRNAEVEGSTPFASTDSQLKATCCGGWPFVLPAVVCRANLLALRTEPTPLMADTFDPYHKWLGIPPQDQPPNHYRLLGINLFETDPDVIDAAANQRMGYIQSCAEGPHIALSQKLLNEVAAARVCLLDSQRRGEYDAQLKKRLAPPKKASSAGKSSGNAPPKTERIVAEKTRPRMTVPAVPPRREASDEMALGPLGATTPTTSASSVAARGKKKSSQTTLIAIALAVVAVAAIGGWLAFSGGGSNVADDYPGVVIDDKQAQRDGSWSAATDGNPIGGQHLLDDGSGDGKNTVTFSAEGLEPGYYDTLLAYVPGDNRASNVLVFIKADDPLPKQNRINQKQPPAVGGKFQSLGMFNFTGREGQKVQVSCGGADGVVSVDAIQFIKK